MQARVQPRYGVILPSTSIPPLIKSALASLLHRAFHYTSVIHPHWAMVGVMRDRIVRTFWKIVDYFCYAITSIHLTFVDGIYGSESASAFDRRRQTGQVLQPLGESLLQICCRCSREESPIQFLIVAASGPPKQLVSMGRWAATSSQALAPPDDPASTSVRRTAGGPGFHREREVDG
jgi:hypothetical protein